MAATVVTYIRGSQYVRDTKGACGLVGELMVGGETYRTLERMDGYVNMAGNNDYTNSTMYWFEKYGAYVINPWLGKDVEKTKKKNILFHPASIPTDLEGCVGVGTLNAAGLMTQSKAKFAKIWEACGGTPGKKEGQIIITLRVQGQMKSPAACTAWAG